MKLDYWFHNGTIVCPKGGYGWISFVYYINSMTNLSVTNANSDAALDYWFHNGVVGCP